MTPPSAEAAVIEPGFGETALAQVSPAGAVAPRRSALLWRALIRDLAAVWRPFWRSRLLVLIAGGLAIFLLGNADAQWTFDPGDVSTSFGHLGNALLGPSVRWDSIYYLQIAQHGYASPRLAAFYPLYPLLIRATAWIPGPLAVSGILISLAAMLATLVIVRRLTALELGEPSAGLTVQLLAFGPMALFLSAVYTESLFLALTSGTFYAARGGRWRAAGVLGALAAMTRSGGFLIFVPVLVMFFWGPRADASLRPVTGRWRPRYRFEPAVLWSLLIPLGAALVPAYFSLRGFGVTAHVQAQVHDQDHVLALPVSTAWNGLVAGWHELTAELTGAPAMHPTQALFQAIVLLAVMAATVGVFRRLPLAYGIYTALGIYALHLSTPAVGDPLEGLARYASLRFPLFMFLGAWAARSRRARVLLIGFGVLLVLFTAQFATWHIVGTPTL